MDRAADEEQAGDIRARHEENQDHGAEQHSQHRRGAAGHLLMQRHQPDAGVSTVRIRVLVTQPPGDRGKVVSGLRRGDVRLQATNDPQERLCPVAPSRIGGGRVRHDDFGVANQGDEVRPEDADDRERFAVQHERIAAATCRD